MKQHCYYLPCVPHNLVNKCEQPKLKCNLFFVFQRSHQKIEDSEESSDEILARLTSAVRPRDFPAQECRNNEGSWKGGTVGSDVGRHLPCGCSSLWEAQVTVKADNGIHLLCPQAASPARLQMLLMESSWNIREGLFFFFFKTLWLNLGKTVTCCTKEKGLYVSLGNKRPPQPTEDQFSSF